MYTQILYPCAVHLTSYGSEEIDKITRNMTVMCLTHYNLYDARCNEEINNIKKKR